MSIVDRIMVNPGSSWTELFEKSQFFHSYRTYVQVIASASSAELIKDWQVWPSCELFNVRLRTLGAERSNPSCAP